MGADTRHGGNAFIPYPTDRVVGTIEDATDVRGAIDALSEAGFARDLIDVLHGEDDLHRLVPAKTTDFWRGFSGRWSAWPDRSRNTSIWRATSTMYRLMFVGRRRTSGPERRHNPRR